MGSPWAYGLSCAYIIMGLFLPIVLWEEVFLGPPCGSRVWQSIKGNPQNHGAVSPLHGHWSRLSPRPQARGSLR